MADANLARQLTEQVSRLRQRQTGPLILELDLTDGLPEGPVTDPVSAIMSRRKIRLSDVLDGLLRARHDDRVRALVVKVGGSRIGLARMQEIREAVAAFRESGKLAVAWAETFGEFTGGNVPYYMATAFDRIYLQPSGTVGLTGITVEQVFLHDALARIGVGFQSAKRYEYKSAADNLTESGFTGPAREASERLAASIAEQISAAIAERRGKSAADARALLDRGPFLAADALAEGLVDALGYRDEVYADVRKEAGPDATLQYVARYQRSHLLAQRARQLPKPRERFVAVIYASGPIKSGRSTRSPLGGSAIGSDTVAAALRSALSDERVRAVLLRVNSPGGSATASDTIWREVVRLRAAGKPVVVSMSDVAASGGYYIAAAADVIVAQPGTITGSIGVIMGKPVLEDALHRVGVTTDSISVGAGATMLSPFHPFTEDEWSRINTWMDAIYRDFTEKVASGRQMSVERVHEVARGRVWTGADAAQNGLVDELGGMRAAAKIARRRAGLPADAPLRIYPRLTPLDQLRPPESSESRPAAAASLGLGVADMFAGWGPAWRLAAQAGLSPYGPLMLPGSWTIH
ncbi:MAG: signal peptide peptidase SppA [Actinomycetota bacterium]|nr:signal peptide peptidase SppA [Actinomycetota bacterium]